MGGLSDFLGIEGKETDSLGVQNGFRELMSLYIEQIVSEGKWFTVCHKIDDRQVDLMSLKNSRGVKIGSMLSDIYGSHIYRTAIYKYMLGAYLCYMEVPSVNYKTDTGVAKYTFNKMLVTSNSGVMAEWLGVAESELPTKYSSRVNTFDFEDDSDEIPYVKLTQDKEGNRKISVPRSDIDLSIKGTRVIPLFMLKEGVDTLFKILEKGNTKVTFSKDSGQLRDLIGTVNEDVIKEIYGEGDFLEKAISMGYNGKFLTNPNITSGYIRVTEIGGSRYDMPVRSISYARIVSIEEAQEPDLSFINIDIDEAIDGFTTGICNYPNSAKDIIDMLEAFELDYGFWEKDKNGEVKSKDVYTLEEWVNNYNALLGTTFKRDLSLFLLGNPQWFSNFTGEPRVVTSYSNNYGDIGLA